MASYKVSYQVLSEQGETLKGLARELDGYASEINNVRSRLGSDQLLASVRQNLQKLSQQLEENRLLLQMAGEVVDECVDGYGQIEITIVQHVDSVRAHNRDFYKNPVSVPSTGGGAAVAGRLGAAAAVSGQMPAEAAPMAARVTPTAAGAAYTAAGAASMEARTAPMAAGAAAPMAAGTAPVSEPVSAPQSTVYTETNTTTTNTTVYVSSTDTGSPTPVAAEIPTGAEYGSSVTKVASAGADVVLQAEKGLSGAAIGAIAGGVGAAAGAGTLFGAARLTKYLKDQKAKTPEVPEGVPPTEPEEDPEVLLARALEEAAKYRREEPVIEDTTPKFGGN